MIERTVSDSEQQKTPLETKRLKKLFNVDLKIIQPKAKVLQKS